MSATCHFCQLHFLIKQAGVYYYIEWFILVGGSTCSDISERTHRSFPRTRHVLYAWGVWWNKTYWLFQAGKTCYGATEKGHGGTPAESGTVSHINMVIEYYRTHTVVDCKQNSFGVFSFCLITCRDDNSQFFYMALITRARFSRHQCVMCTDDGFFFNKWFMIISYTLFLLSVWIMGHSKWYIVQNIFHLFYQQDLWNKSEFLQIFLFVVKMMPVHLFLNVT